jgi:nicotinate-nucleotide adenylyltransferase
VLYQSVAKEMLSSKRYNHCVNVAKTAGRLAVKYGASREKAKISGILHDLTKEWTNFEHMKFITENNIPITRYEIASKKLLHAITCSFYLQIVLKIRDFDIINAVRFHTTARKGMSMLEKVVFIADFISAERNFNGVNKLRMLAERSMESVMPEALSFSIVELVDEKKVIHPDTFEAYNEVIFENLERAKFLSGINNHPRKPKN